MAIFSFHKVGGSRDSGELAGVGTSEVEQLGRRDVAAEVASGSRTGAGQRRRLALSVGLPGSATDLGAQFYGLVFSLEKWRGCA